MTRIARAALLLIFAAAFAAPALAADPPSSPAGASADMPAPPAPAARPAPPAARYTIDFSDVDIRKVIETVSDITGRNFLVDDRVQGRVMVIGPKSLSSEEVYQVFLSILQVKGFTVVPAGKVEKIVPAANVINFAPEMRSEKGSGTTDRYVTQVIALQYAEAEDVRNLVTPIVPKTDSISAYNPTNLLIITTTEALLARVGQIVALVDVPGTREDVRIIPVQFAPVADLAQKLGQVLDTSGGKSSPQRAGRPAQPGEAAASSARGDARIIPDERTSSLIVIADTPTAERIAEMVRKLDVPAPPGGGKIHVYYLQYADASDLAKVLSGIPLEAASGEPSKAAAPGQPAPGPAPAASRGDAKASIIADKATNSLVITATPAEFEYLSGVIQKLDIPRDQVMVEVLIAEVSVDKAREIGVEWRVAEKKTGPDGEYIQFGATSFGGINGLTPDATTGYIGLPDGFLVGAIGENIQMGGINFPNLGALIRALATKSDVNILSTPTLVTTDNQQAEIVVGETVPFKTATKYDSTSNAQTVDTYDYRDVGLTLRLTPQINRDRFVRLKVFSQLEAMVNTTGSSATSLTPTTLKRKAETSLLVKDGQTVVIGGLLRDDQTMTESKVPLLGDIPLLGALFRSRSTKDQKTNLLIFLTPHIIASEVEASEAAKAKLRSSPLLPARLEGVSLDPPGAAPGQGAPAGTAAPAVPAPAEGTP